MGSASSRAVPGGLLARAKYHEREARKAEKIRPWALSFSTDYPIAILEYRSAGEAFMGAGEPVKAANAYIAAAKVAKKAKDHFGAGRLYEAAGASFRSCYDWDHYLQSIWSAAECYPLAGKIDTGVACLLRYASTCVDRLHDTARASAAYHKAAQLLELQDNRIAGLIEVYQLHTMLLVRQLLRDLAPSKAVPIDTTELFTVYDKLMAAQVKLNRLAAYGNTILSKILWSLWLQNVSLAQCSLTKAVEIYPGFLGTRGYDVCQGLIDLYDGGDASDAGIELARLLSSSVVKYLPIEMIHLAQRLRPPTHLDITSDQDVLSQTKKSSH